MQKPDPTVLTRLDLVKQLRACRLVVGADLHRAAVAANASHMQGTRAGQGTARHD